MSSHCTARPASLYASRWRTGIMQGTYVRNDKLTSLLRCTAAAAAATVMATAMLWLTLHRPMTDLSTEYVVYRYIYWSVKASTWNYQDIIVIIIIVTSRGFLTALSKYRSEVMHMVITGVRTLSLRHNRSDRWYKKTDSSGYIAKFVLFGFWQEIRFIISQNVRNIPGKLCNRCFNRK